MSANLRPSAENPKCAFLAIYTEITDRDANFLAIYRFSIHFSAVSADFEAFRKIYEPQKAAPAALS